MLQQLLADALRDRVRELADGEKVTIEMRPAKLPVPQRVPVVCAMAVADHHRVEQVVADLDAE